MQSKIIEYRSVIKESIKKRKVPGLSISVIKDNSIYWTEAFGFKSVITKELVDEKTIFEGASFTKPIVAFITLKLCDTGLITLDTPLCYYLNEPYLHNEPLYEQITTRHVLSHRSGFPNWRGKEELKVLFTPGERFEYSGEGFVCLQAVLEKLTDKTLNELAIEYVFNAFKMTNSSLIWLNKLSENIAIRHNEQGETGEVRKMLKANAAYSLYCTAEDYAKFIVHMMNINENLSAEMSKQIFSKQTFLAPYAYWGLGWGIEENNEKTCWHWGDNGGFKAVTCFTPDTKRGVVILTNGFHGLLACQDILNEIYGSSASFNQIIRMFYS